MHAPLFTLTSHTKPYPHVPLINPPPLPTPHFPLTSLPCISHHPLSTHLRLTSALQHALHILFHPDSFSIICPSPHVHMPLCHISLSFSPISFTLHHFNAPLSSRLPASSCQLYPPTARPHITSIHPSPPPHIASIHPSTTP